MKKYLMRSGINPLEYKTPKDLIGKDFIGTNPGNLIYAYGIYRNLVSENVEIHSDNYAINFSEIEYINNNYDGYIIALADAIRSDFMGQLRLLTKMIKQLDIPVYLIGMGIRAPYNVDHETLSFDFDDTVREFVKAVLEKSEIVGLRGKITAQYLSNLGFIEGKDHIAIGCPSMYTFGPNLKIKNSEILTDTSLITTNLSKPAPKSVKKYISNIHHNYKKATFLPQGYDEFKLLYSGSSTFFSEDYPSSLEDIQYSTGNPKFFLNAPTWIDFMKTVDFSFGTKLHGNITATIAGTPSITIPLDARMRELVEYHNLTSLELEKFDDSKTLQQLISEADIHAPEEKQKENYEKFIDFLKANHLEPVVQVPGQKIYADELLENSTLYPVITSSIDTTEEEKAIRMANLNSGNFAKESNLRMAIDRLKGNNAKLQNRNIELRKKLEKATMEINIKSTENQKIQQKQQKQEELLNQIEKNFLELNLLMKD